MFERFTRDARSVVVDAQQVARELRSPTIDSRHLVVALAQGPGPVATALRAVGADPDDVAASARRDLAAGDPLDGAALAAVGVDVDRVRQQADQVFGPGSLDRAGRRTARRGGHHAFAKDARKALELSLREAVRLHEKSIGRRHLLLGVLRADCPGGRVLQSALHDAGTDVPTLRDTVEQVRA
ncbi:Clp protease N-terminal domain-containing protein [Isoptericola jiangsuensis]|uniref:Clp protease N-terminal domain-containing protein n=1 Tax=Isoptericola jiangsuensis TaxID=548579 RepID=UPI003AAAC338